MIMYFYLILLFTHWVADFIFQTNWEATNKSKNNIALLSHTTKYSIIMLLPVVFNLTFTLEDIAAFWAITFFCHTITDFFTSRINSKLWAKQDVHNFFVSIGFDQFLHALQLGLTYMFLINYGMSHMVFCSIYNR